MPRASFVAKAAFAYFAVVFSVGFVLGAVRTLFIVPRLGVRSAALLETPIMLVTVFLCARWITRRARWARERDWLVVGLLALTLMLLTEFTVVLALRGLSLREYFTTRDAVSGAVYWASLGVFAVCPWLLVRAGAGSHLHGNGPAA